MLIVEALGALQFLKKELITLAELGEVLGIGRAAMSGRVQRKSVLKPEEIKALENHYGVSLEQFCVQPSSQDKTELVQTVKNTMKELFVQYGLDDMAKKISEQS